MATNAATAPGSESPAAFGRRIARAAAALTITAAIILLPAISATISYRQTGEPPERDLVKGAMLISGVMAALAWALFGLIHVVRKMNFMAATATRGGGFLLADPELIRNVLAQHDIACGRCGYNLRGLPGGTCPECREPITLSLAGADPLGPLIWLTRLAVFGYLFFVVRGALGAVRPVRIWPMYSWSFPGSNMSVIKLGLVLQPILSLGGFVLLAILAFAWVNTEAGKARAVARWRVLNVTVALLFLMAIAELATGLLLN